jgi:rubrerythrin
MRMKVDFSGDEIRIYDFNELEAYRVARKLEQDGIYYYSRMMEEVLKPKIREVVEMLLGDERRHLRLFEEKVVELSRAGGDADDEETLPEIVDSHVMDILKDSARVADILCNPQEALRLGIAVENRSIAFYGAILEKTHDDSGSKAIQELIQEEKDHLEKLEGMLRK